MSEGVDRGIRRRPWGMTPGCWIGVALAVIPIVNSPWVAGPWYVVDIWCSLAAQWGILAGIGAVLCGAVGRWSAAAGCGAVVVSAVLVQGVPRAELVAVPAGGERLTVLSWNCLPTNPDPAGVVRLVLEKRPDVAVLHEVPGGICERLRDETALLEAYPWVQMRVPAENRNGWTLVLSRWPVRSLDWPAEEGGPTEREGWRAFKYFDVQPFPMAVEVQTPGGKWLVVSVYGMSPRTLGRWRAGNETVRRAAEWAMKGTAAGVPVVLAGDINAAAGGYRSRYLGRERGLERGKPRWMPSGTFPAGLPWPLRLAIDDVWVGGGGALSGWELLGAHGSDHLPVFAEVVRTAGMSDSTGTPGDAE